MKVLKLVTGAELSINDDDRYNVCFVTPSNRIKHANKAADAEKRELLKRVQSEEMKAWRKWIRLAKNNDLSTIVNDVVTPRSESPAKKTPVWIKLSLKKPIVATPDSLIPTMMSLIPTMTSLIPTMTSVILTMTSLIPTMMSLIPTMSSLIPTMTSLILTMTV